MKNETKNTRAQLLETVRYYLGWLNQDFGDYFHEISDDDLRDEIKQLKTRAERVDPSWL